MPRKNPSKKQVISILITIVLILITSLIIYFTFKLILYPSYLSVLGSCLPDGEEFLDRQGYMVAGITAYNTETKEINVSIIGDDTEEIDKNTLRHEFVHVIQARDLRFYGCNELPKQYGNEIESYLASYYPDWIFKRIYGDYTSIGN